MTSYPATSKDTVLYEEENIYGDKDITVTMLDSAKLNVWGETWINGNLVTGATMPVATQAEALAGTDNTKVMTPLRAKEIKPYVDVRQFGAVGDDSTDNATALRNAFLFSGMNGRNIYIPPGIFCTSLPLDFISNCTIYCAGTIKITQNAIQGGLLLIKNGNENILWIGGTLDGGGTLGVVNMNGITAAYDADDFQISKNIRFIGTRVINCRRDPEASSLFNGGGKGLTVQFHVHGAIFEDIMVEDCDFPFTVETAYSENRVVENVVISNFIGKNCTYGALLTGSKPATTGSGSDWGYEESKYGQTRITATLDNCGGTTASFGTSLGAITSNWATCLDAQFVIRNSADSTNKVTLWRGNVAHSRIKIDAFVDNLQDAISFVPVTGFTNEGLSSAGYQFDATVRVADSIAGVLWRGVNAIVLGGKTSINYYHTTIPTLMAGFDANLNIQYDFWDMRTGKSCRGNCSIDALPSMSDFGGLGFYDNMYVQGQIISTASIVGNWTETASTSSYTPTPVSHQGVYITALAVSTLTFNAPTGTPKRGQEYEIWVKDNGTSRTLAFTGSWLVPIGVTLPTATVASKWTYIKMKWNNNAAQWQAIDVKTQT